MTYTQSPLERQLMKKEESRVGLPWRLLTVGFLTFGVTLGIYFGMSFGLKPFLDHQIENVDSELEQLANSVSEDEASGFLIFYSQMANMNETLKNKQLISNKFDLLEKNTLKNIYYKNLNINYASNFMRVDGRVPDFEILAEQLEIFKNSTDVDKVSLSSATLSEEKEGGVNFAMQINFKK
ncbi:hypothetical protein COV23_00230 [Candidatus Wolfebacteria bacterium CG10_big_fil_rev_8_21_14_0_10_31_9]|uniref:Uncharacterized protein n=1 Tax=Candidatus Wolfebacteria bacterium CG10_big_fil_rev_8_21_14_0_10_31_9 TaxID=1975070 RepID=A0A2H0RD14_9BACT|nr:MAG: hypothetical protein COV23_00230 [Candidatus Wolfebacteria bacterium CG10_big_fil_rev_8_21_14_0_10_31_9]